MSEYQQLDLDTDVPIEQGVKYQTLTQTQNLGFKSPSEGDVAKANRIRQETYIQSRSYGRGSTFLALFLSVVSGVLFYLPSLSTDTVRSVSFYMTLVALIIAAVTYLTLWNTTNACVKGFVATWWLPVVLCVVGVFSVAAYFINEYTTWFETADASSSSQPSSHSSPHSYASSPSSSPSSQPSLPSSPSSPPSLPPSSKKSIKTLVRQICMGVLLAVILSIGLLNLFSFETQVCQEEQETLYDFVARRQHEQQ